MASADQTFIDLEQNLFGTPDGIWADDSQPESYAENGKTHAARPIGVKR